MACNNDMNQNTTRRGSNGFVIIVVLYILLAIITVGRGYNF